MISFRLRFDGGSWALGLLTGLVYFGYLSPWWLLITLFFVVRVSLLRG